jgi:hypothetical protein
MRVRYGLVILRTPLPPRLRGISLNRLLPLRPLEPARKDQKYNPENDQDQAVDQSKSLE